LAVLGVVTFHFLLAFAPYLAPGYGAWPYGLIDSPLGLVVNGRSLITLFFVLSGFLVAQAAAGRRDFLPMTLALRYVRLAGPVLVSVIVAYGLYGLLPDAADNAYRLTPHAWLKQAFQGPPPTLLDVLQQGLIEPFWSGKSALNNAYWTLRIELIGSCTILAIYWAVKGVLRWGALILMAACAASPWLPVDYLAFALGALLRELFIAQKLPAKFAPLALLVGFALGAPGPGLADRYALFAAWPDRLLPGQDGSICAPLAGALIVWGVLQVKAVANLLSGRALTDVGKISYFVFLLHVPIIYTICCANYVVFHNHGAKMWIIVAASLLVACTASATLLGHFIEAPLISASTRLRNLVSALMQSSIDGVSIGRPRIKVNRSWPDLEPGQ
jgi:peptidoglycan/LPS O-acetylase OafA/YrhL